MIFTDKMQVYKGKCSEFEDSKASLLGDYLPTKLAMDPEESVLGICLTGDYSGSVLFVYENGKVARVAMSAYETKTNRKKLTGAYSDKSPLKSIIPLSDDQTQIALITTEGRALIFSASQLGIKATRATQGVGVMTLKKKYLVERGEMLSNSAITNHSRYRTRTIPATGSLLKEEDTGETQIALDL